MTPTESEWANDDFLDRLDAKIAKAIGWTETESYRHIWWDPVKNKPSGYDRAHGGANYWWNPTGDIKQAFFAVYLVRKRRRLAFSLTVDETGEWRATFDIRRPEGPLGCADRDPLRAICGAIGEVANIEDPERIFKRRP